MRVLLLSMWKYEYAGRQEGHNAQKGEAVRLRKKKMCSKPMLYKGSMPVTDGVVAFGMW